MAKYLDSTGISTLWSKCKSTFYHSGNSNSTSYSWSAKSLTLGGQIVGSDMSSAAIYGLYLNQSNVEADGYRASGDNGYIQVPMISGNSMGYLYTALVRYSTAGYSYVKFILNGQAGAWKQFAYTSDLPSKSSWNYDDRYVTALGTSGNNLTWTKNGTDNTITVPYATSAGSVAWGNITGKPDTYTPSDHNHDSSYLPRYEVWIEQTDDWGKTYAESHRQSLVYNTHGREWAYWIGMRSSGINYGTILRLSHDGLVQYAHKAGGGAGENWSAWKNIITSDNIGSQSVSYAGSAGSVAWSNVSGKPDTYTPSSHDHDSIYVKKSGSTMTGNLTMTEGYGIVFGTKTDGNWNTTQNSGLRILNTAGYSRDGAPGNYSVALSVSGYYGFQLACVNASNDFRLRHTSDGRDASNYGAWVNILCSNNWSTYVNLSSLGAAASSHTHSYLPLSGGTITSTSTTPLIITTDKDYNYISIRANSTAKGEIGYYHNGPGNVGMMYMQVYGPNNTYPTFGLSTDGNGYIGSNKIYHAGNIPSYLLTSGGTLTNNNFGEQLTIKRSYTGGDACIRYQVNDTVVGYIGVKADTTPVFYSGTNTSGSGYTIWHSGNDGSGSGLDADTLDGNHASAFATAGHTHSNYLLSSQVSTPQDSTYGDSMVSWAEGYAEAHPASYVYNSYGAEYSYLVSLNSNTSYGTILKIGYSDKYLRILRKSGGTWQSNDWEKISAGYADSAGAVAWSGISSKPDTATRWPSWSEVTGKPDSFTPSSHNHDEYAVWKRVNQRFDTNIPGGIYSVYNSASVSDVPGDIGLINIPTYSGHRENYFFQTQIRFGTNDNTPKIRWVKKESANSDPEASNWVSCWHSGNLVNLTNSEIDTIMS